MDPTRGQQGEGDPETESVPGVRGGPAGRHTHIIITAGFIRCVHMLRHLSATNEVVVVPTPKFWRWVFYTKSDKTLVSAKWRRPKKSARIS